MCCAQLAVLYRNTTYRVRLRSGRGIDLRIGRRHPELDRLLHEVAARHWGFLTAWNPLSTSLPAWRNAARQRRLIAALGRAGICLEGTGLADCDDWREASLFVAPLAPGHARRLGRSFGQCAVVIGVRGRAAELCWCRRRLTD